MAEQLLLEVKTTGGFFFFPGLFCLPLPVTMVAVYYQDSSQANMSGHTRHLLWKSFAVKCIILGSVKNSWEKSKSLQCTEQDVGSSGVKLSIYKTKFWQVW